MRETACMFCSKKTIFIEKNTTGGEGGVKRRGLGLRNDVLTTCKVVTALGGQPIIAVFFPQ